MQSFTIEVPRTRHPHYRLKMAQVPWIKLHTNTNAGTVTPPEAMGLEYEYAPVPNEDKVKITITKNPHNVSEELLKSKITEQFVKWDNEIPAHAAGGAHTQEVAQKPLSPPMPGTDTPGPHATGEQASPMPGTKTVKPKDPLKA